MLDFKKIKAVYEYWDALSGEKGVEVESLKEALNEAGANLNDHTFSQ